MRFNLLTLGFAVIIISTASAQKFSPGYYIKLSGDTVRKDLSLQMKRDYIDKIVTPEGLFLAPKDVLGFQLNLVNYVVRKVSMDKTPDHGFVTDTVFLEVMNRGKISLLYIIDENSKVHFYIENENGPQELTVRLNDKNDGIVVRKIETYKSALKGIFPTCTDLFPTIDKVLFNRKAIQAIYEKLYRCRYQEDAPTTKKEENVRSTDIGVYAGLWSTTQKFIINAGAGNMANFAARMTYPGRSNAPTFGAYLETKFTRNHSLALRHEISYISYDIVSNDYKINEYQTTTYKATFKASYIRYSFIARLYFLPKSNFKPFITGGVSPSYALSQKNVMERTGSDPGTSPVFTQKISKVTVSGLLGLGIVYKSFGLEFRKEFMRSMSRETSGQLNVNSFTLHYRIKRYGE